MKTKSEHDFAAWLGQMKLYKRLCRHKRRDYWNNKLTDPKNKMANIRSHINFDNNWDNNFEVSGFAKACMAVTLIFFI